MAIRINRRLDRIQKDRAVEFVDLAPSVVDGDGDGQRGRYLHQVGGEAKIFRGEGDLLRSVAGGNEE